jgi:hypothetical protein
MPVRSCRVTDVPIEHDVKLQDSLKCVERKGGSPRETSDRLRVREIIGLPNPSRKPYGEQKAKHVMLPSCPSAPAASPSPI